MMNTELIKDIKELSNSFLQEVAIQVTETDFQDEDGIVYRLILTFRDSNLPINAAHKLRFDLSRGYLSLDNGRSYVYATTYHNNSLDGLLKDVIEHLSAFKEALISSNANK